MSPGETTAERKLWLRSEEVDEWPEPVERVAAVLRARGIVNSREHLESLFHEIHRLNLKDTNRR